MTTYRYRGQSLDGAKVTGVIRAYDEFEAVSQLRDRCAFITKIEPVKEKQGNPLTRPVNTRIREKELAMLCSQLSILLSSGLTALRCLQMVAAQTRNKQLRRALEKAAEEVARAAPWRTASKATGRCAFPPRLWRPSGPVSSPARWRRVCSGCRATMSAPPRPGPRWSAP